MSKVSKDVRDNSQGNPAFPHWDGPSGECFNGMSLRDYFAAAALQGMLANGYMPAQVVRHGGEYDYCEAAYRLAETMLAERAK